MEQLDLGKTRADLAIEALIDYAKATSRQGTVCLVSCGKKKSQEPQAVCDLYLSPLFKYGVDVGSLISDHTCVISAKYGLLELSDKVAPYDLTISNLTQAQRQSLIDNIRQKVSGFIQNGKDEIIILGGAAYSQLVREASEEYLDHVSIVEPLSGLSLGVRLQVLSKIINWKNRRQLAKLLYSSLENLRMRGECEPATSILKTKLPNRGIYLFLDPNEKSDITSHRFRVVRIGTHAVSEGSKSTLRNRLRTHIGTQNGGGSHRSSVFRLHVGECLIKRLGLTSDFPNWGKGSSASKEIVAKEQPMERMVTEYILGLEVAYIEVDDTPSKMSLRSRFEAQLISLFTGDNLLIEKSSENWLGTLSRSKKIRDFGIWNIQHVAIKPDIKVMREAVVKFKESSEGKGFKL